MAGTTSVFTVGVPTAPDIRAPGLPDGPVTALAESASVAHMAWALGPRPGRDGASGRSIAILSASGPTASRRAVELLRSTLFPSRLAIHTTRLSPLGALVLAKLAESLATRLGSSSLVAGVLPALEREIEVRAWLESVAGLRLPVPSFGQQALSRLPGSSFSVSLAPTPEVHRLSGRQAGTPMERPEAPTAALVAGREANPEWVASVVEPAFSGGSVADVDAGPEASAWWGARRVVEVVTYPTDLEDLAERLGRDVSAADCRWCGATSATPVCPFCRHPRARSGRRAERVA